MMAAGFQKHLLQTRRWCENRYSVKRNNQAEVNTRTRGLCLKAAAVAAALGRHSFIVALCTERANVAIAF